LSKKLNEIPRLRPGDFFDISTVYGILLPVMFAIIKTGGKQYKVEKGQRLKIEKLDKTGEFSFDQVLLTSDGKSAEIGKPFISGATVEAKALGEVRGEKKITLTYHSKARVRRKKGHRQTYTEVEILKV